MVLIFFSFFFHQEEGNCSAVFPKLKQAHTTLRAIVRKRERDREREMPRGPEAQTQKIYNWLAWQKFHFDLANTSWSRSARGGAYSPGRQSSEPPDRTVTTHTKTKTKRKGRGKGRGKASCKSLLQTGIRSWPLLECKFAR